MICFTNQVTSYTHASQSLISLLRVTSHWSLCKMNSVHCDPSRHSSEVNLSCHYALSSQANSSHLGLTTKSLQLVLISSTNITSSTPFISLEVITPQYVCRQIIEVERSAFFFDFTRWLFFVRIHDLLSATYFCFGSFVGFFFSFYRQVLGYSVFAITANFHSSVISLVTSNSALHNLAFQFVVIRVRIKSKYITPLQTQ